MADVPEDTIEVNVVPRLPPRDAELVAAARGAAQEAAGTAARASELSRQAVEQLRSGGMTVRDEEHRITVLHYDADYDTISEFSDLQALWIVARGEVG